MSEEIQDTENLIEEEDSDSPQEISLSNGEESEALIPDDGRAWFVVHCYSGYENKVRHSI